MNFTNTTDTNYVGESKDIIELVIILLVIAIAIVCCVKNGGCKDEPQNNGVYRAQLRRAARGQGPLIGI